METIVWSDETFSVGHAKIDEQHKILVKNLNDLIVLQKQRFNQKQQRQIIAQLEKYVDLHLRYEEALLRKVGYDAYDEHEQLHSEFLMEVEMWSMMVEDEDPALPGRMCAFLKHWLMEHILGEDMKFRAYIKQ